MYECKECNLVFENHILKANHVRWNHKDSAYSEVGIKNLKEKVKKSINARFGKLINETVDCPKCKTPFQRKRRDSVDGLQKAKKFCSRPCANSRTWSKSDKLKKSAASKNSLLIKQRVLITCQQCGIKKEVIHSRKSQKCCSSACAQKYRYRDQNIFGNRKHYRNSASFKFSLNDYPDVFDFELIAKHGWYSPSNSKNPNPSGVSRDHMLSVAAGFKDGISPEILAHPANCKLILQTENFKKLDSCSISLDDLLKKIKLWDERNK